LPTFFDQAFGPAPTLRGKIFVVLEEGVAGFVVTISPGGTGSPRVSFAKPGAFAAEQRLSPLPSSKR
jgi:hypothetical protein